MVHTYNRGYVVGTCDGGLARGTAIESGEKVELSGRPPLPLKYGCEKMAGVKNCGNNYCWPAPFFPNKLEEEWSKWREQKYGGTNGR